MGTGTTIKSSPTGAGTTTSMVRLIIPDNSIPLAFDQFNLSDFDTFFASLPPLGALWPIHWPILSSGSFWLSSCMTPLTHLIINLPHPSLVNWQIRFYLCSHVIQLCLVVHHSLIPIIYHLLHLSDASTSGINIIDPNIPDPLTGVMAGRNVEQHATMFHPHVSIFSMQSGRQVHTCTHLSLLIKKTTSDGRPNSTGAGPQSRK